MAGELPRSKPNREPGGDTERESGAQDDQRKLSVFAEHETSLSGGHARTEARHGSSADSVTFNQITATPEKPPLSPRTAAALEKLATLPVEDLLKMGDTVKQFTQSAKDLKESSQELKTASDLKPMTIAVCKMETKVSEL